MIVSEFIEWLKTQDPDAAVKVVIVTDRSGDYETIIDVKTEDFDPAVSPRTFSVADYRNSTYAPVGSRLFNLNELVLGRDDT